MAEKYTVLFVDSGKSVSELIELIGDATGFHAPLIKVNVRKFRTTNYAFCGVPEQVGQKLIETEFKGATFSPAKFREVEFDENFRGVYVRSPKTIPGHLVRSTVVDTMNQLEQRGLVSKEKWFFSKHNRLFINSTDEEAYITQAFINGAPYMYGGKIYYVQSSYLRKDNGKEELM